MMKKKIFTILVITALTITCIAGCAKKDAGETALSSEVSISSVEEDISISADGEADTNETLELSLDDITLLSDIISGIEGMEISETTELLSLITYDPDIVTEITADDSAVDYTVSGTYDVIYNIAFDRDTLVTYLMDHDIELSDDVMAAINSYADTEITLTFPSTVIVNVSDEDATMDNTDSDTDSASASGTTNTTMGTSQPSNSSNSNVTNGSNNASTSSANSTTASGSSSTTTTCNHNWVEQTTEIYHEEEGHYETITVAETVTCNYCGTVFASYEEWKSHFLEVGTPHGAYTVHEAHTTSEWVVDQAAYTETIVTGYRCSICGATK